MENDTKNSKQKNMGKIWIPVLIVVAIGAVWFAKNGITPNNAGRISTGVEDTSNPDFALEVTEVLDIEELKRYGLPIVIDFGADSCIPCREMAPVLKELNAELRGQAIIKFVDVWKYPDLADGYPISVIPTQLFFDAQGNAYIPTDPETAQMLMYKNRDTNEHVFTAHQGGMNKEMLLEALAEMGLEQ